MMRNIATFFSTSTKGAVDLGAVIVGVIVFGVLAISVGTAIFGVIPWSQDNQAKADLDKIASAQSSYSYKKQVYGSASDLVAAGFIEAEPHWNTIVANSGNCYLAVIRSQSGRVFFDTSQASEPELYTTESMSLCGDVEAAVEELKAGAIIVAPPVIHKPLPSTDAPTAEIEKSPVGDQPAVRMVDTTQNVTYTVQPNSYNKQQLLLNVTIVGGNEHKQDWELRVKSTEATVAPFNQIEGFVQVNDSRVSQHKDADEYVFKNTALGQYGNTVSKTSTFSTTIVFNFDIRHSNDITVMSGAPSGGAWYATQNIKVFTTSDVYVYWKIRLDLADLKTLASSTNKITVNHGSVRITHDTGSFYWVEPLNDNMAVNTKFNANFDIAASN